MHGVANATVANTPNKVVVKHAVPKVNCHACRSMLFSSDSSLGKSTVPHLEA